MSEDTCSTCCSTHLAFVGGKVSDRFNAFDYQTDSDYDGYVPEDLGIGSGDYIRINYCLDCGQIQGDFPQAGESISGRVKWEVVYLVPWDEDCQVVIAYGDASEFDADSFEAMVQGSHHRAITPEEFEAIEIVTSEIF